MSKALGLAIAVAAAIGLGLLSQIGSYGPAVARAASLADVKSWHYQLQGVDLEKLQATPGDMLVIDYAVSAPGGMRPLAAAEIARLKRKPDGRRRLVIAYLSIGEAEEYRPYWRSHWKTSPPDWHIVENCRWPRNHLVRFWHPGWREIMFDGPDSYLARIQAAGFDGVYLDRIDIYWDLRERVPDAEARIIRFVDDLASRARASDPQFIVIAQNAEGLLVHRDYLAAIDGIAKEDLLNGVNGTGKRNPNDMIAWSLAKLKLAREAGKALFAVEYLTTPEAVATARGELERLQAVSVFPDRALDGSDPLTKPPAAPQLETQYGTPEWGTSRCDGVFPKTG